MIREIYIDNFRCLVNFRIELTSFQLWLGSNGSGKSSVLDALRNIQRVLSGEKVGDIFSEASLTKWDKRRVQTFGVTLESAGESYAYRLEVEQQSNGDHCRIASETLKWKGQNFYRFDGREAHLFRINRNTGEAEEGATFSANWGRSMIPNIEERNDNHPLVQFRVLMGKCLLIQPVPLVVQQVAKDETRKLSRYAENFAPWYRHILQEHPGIGFKAGKLLAEVLPGFVELSLREIGDTRRLKATFRINGEDRVFEFAELSDGKRQLIILYTLLESLRAGIYSVIAVDEPDNFVSLREIEPWVAAIQEICEDTDGQGILISHHPEIINKMTDGTELWFSRPEGGLAVTTQFPTCEGLTPAETVARGWENG